MPNAPVTITWVTNESGQRFKNSLAFAGTIDRSYDDQFAKKGGAKVGNTILARLPNLPTIRSGQGWAPTGVTDRTVPVTLTYQKGADFEWSSIQQTTELDEIRNRYINPAADGLASTVDMDAMNDVYATIFNNQGTPGTTASTNLTYLTAASKIFDLAGPSAQLAAVLDVVSQITLQNANLTIFNPQNKIGENFRNGRFSGPALGIDDWFTTQSTPTHTTGTFTSCTPQINAANQTGSSVTSNGWASAATTLLKGDVVEFAGCYSVNPLTKKSTGRLQQFVITANCTDSTGTMTLPISPSIITSGPLQTVSASPASGAAVYVWNTRSTTYALSTAVSPQNFIYHRDFATLVMVDLEEPIAGAVTRRIQSKDYGISLRMVQQYLLAPDQNGTRLDCIYGTAALQPRLAARVAS